ncbi:hypothetical protein AWB82_03096 [Caballeronia glebae]|uniref:Uncharacterized protein n=1 Tax=Caballeronia glebae TaxID=1777143 RepID=A0A158AW39_9BURK|nr:hypothetical protein [Caballeronia glebae]SAK61963.1 hypothetical protein AWB82_03096 [Caballeronia glebae]
MGLGMQIAYLGFTGSSAIEREAGVELVRLAGVATDIVDCRLTIKASLDRAGHTVFDAQLVLLTRDFQQVMVQRGTDADVSVALHHTFDDAFELLRGRGAPEAY